MTPTTGRVRRLRPQRSQRRRVPLRRGLAVAGSSLVLLAQSPIPALADQRPQPTPEQKAAALIRPAVVFVAVQATGWIRLPNGELLTQPDDDDSIPFMGYWGCTGFVVNPAGWVATAGHCVDPEEARTEVLKNAVATWALAHPEGEEAIDPAGRLRYLTENATVEGMTADRGPEIAVNVAYGSGVDGTFAPATVEAFEPFEEGDVALVRVQGENLPSSELAGDEDVSIGTAVLSVGYPSSADDVTDPTLEPAFTSGKVNRKVTTNTIPQYEIDAEMAQGMSGGPTVNIDGKVIGVNSFRPAAETGAFNFVAPSSRVGDLLASKGVEPSLGPADVAYRRGLDHYFSGDYTQAINDFDEAQTISPGYPGVADLKTKAVTFRAQYGDATPPAGGMFSRWIAGSLLLVACAGALIAWLMVRRRRAGHHPRQRAVLHYATRATAAAGHPELLPPTRLIVGAVESPAEGAGSLPEPHFCSNCGTEHHPDEKYCPSCGHRVAPSLGNRA